MKHVIYITKGSSRHSCYASYIVPCVKRGYLLIRVVKQFEPSGVLVKISGRQDRDTFWVLGDFSDGASNSILPIRWADTTQELNEFVKSASQVDLSRPFSSQELFLMLPEAVETSYDKEALEKVLQIQRELAEAHERYLLNICQLQAELRQGSTDGLDRWSGLPGFLIEKP